MDVHLHTLVRRGDLRIVAFARTADSPPAPDDIAAYAVSDALGVLLCRDLGFDEARVLLDGLAAQQEQSPAPRSPTSRRR